MASIYKRRRNGKSSKWRAAIRIKGFPAITKTFDRKQEAEDWSNDTERKIKLGQFKFDQYKNQKTFIELVDRFLDDGMLEHHKSSKDTLRHLTYWKFRLGKYSLSHLNTDLLSKERKFLLDTPTNQNKKRTNATVNRYFASLSSILTFACRQLAWITDNPCLNFKKLKESSGRDRVLSHEEAVKLIAACKKS